MSDTCTACQRPMPKGARLCVHCGYDRVTRTRALTHGDPQAGTGAADEHAVAPEGGEGGERGWGTFRPAAVILLVFAAPIPFVWKLQTPSLIYAGTAVLLFIPLWLIQRSRASVVVDQVDDEPGVLDGVQETADMLLGGGEEQRTNWRAREITRAMFARETAGRVQTALLASMLTLIAALWLVAAAFR